MRLSAAFAAVLILACLLPSAAAASEVPLIPAWADWRYLDTGVNEETYWREPFYDDSWWDSGPAELGYGDGTERTVVASGPSGNHHITTYFRRSFDVYDPSVFTDLTVRLVRDDGAVVYLNGTEVWRSNMPPGAIDYRTTALSSVGGPDEAAFFSAPIDESLLVAGTNVLAVEIHQVDAVSSDISFNLELIGTSDADIVTLTRGPYLQMGTAESIRIRWRTNSPSNSRVRYGTSVNNLNQTVDVSTNTTEHDVLLSGLSPSTRYYYSVGTSAQILAGDASHTFVTSPFTGSTAPARIWVLGDSGTADYSASSVRDAYLDYTGSTRTNLWLMLGDNAYDIGLDSEFQAAVFEMYPHMLRQSVLWPTIGNHDTAQSQNPPANLPYFNIFTLPTAGEAGGAASGTEKYYSFDYGNIHFICLDSMTSNRSSTGPMLTWLRNDLESTSQQWIIAYWHHPPYSKGSHDSDSEIFLVEMRQNAVPILEEYGVDLVMTGHSHSYERSFLIDSHYGKASTFVSSMKKDGGNGRIDGTGAYTKGTLGAAPHEGAVYVVAGSSGQITPAPLNHPAMYIGLVNLGSLVLDVHGGRLDVKFLRENGAIADYFTIVKGSLPEAPTALSATVASPTSVYLTWTDNSSSEETFRIERCTGASCTSFSEIAQVPADQTNYSSAGLTADTTYRYRVRAANTHGMSGYSNIASATPESCTAPAIATQPQSQSVIAGESATLTVTASGTSPSYQWFAGSTPIGGQTGTSLTVTPASTTSYFVRVTNACGTVDSTAATVTVQPCSYSVSPPSFAFTSGSGSGSASVTTTGTCSWTATTATPWITITSGASGTGNGSVAFTAAANSGAARSGSITIAGTVIPVTQECLAPSITAQPQPATITAGDSATLTVTATGAAPLSYQWYAGATAIDGATSSSLTVTPSSTTSYFVRITSPCGVVDSNTATVTVQPCSLSVSPSSFAFSPAAAGGSISVNTAGNCSWTAVANDPWIAITGGASGRGKGTVTFTVSTNDGGARNGSITIGGVVVPVTQECTAPAITVQPQSTTITAGESTTLNVAATGPSPLSYEWIAGSTPIDGQTGSSITVSPASTTTYKARVTSACGSIDSADATVTVQPCAYSASPSSFAFSAAEGGGSIAVTTTSTCSWTATTATPWITITGASSGTANGTVTFTVAGNGGTARSGSIEIGGTVVPVTQECSMPSITAQPQSTTIITGESTTLTVAATGAAPLSYQWFSGTTLLDGETASSITVSPTSTKSYFVRVTNACGSIDSNTATVTVQPCTYSFSPTSFTFPFAAGNGSVAITTTGTCSWTATTATPWITLTGTTTGTGSGTATFSVAANGGTARSGSIAIAGTVIPVTQACATPTVTTQPQSKTIIIGESTTLTVSVSGATPLSYQWYAGTTPLEGETRSWITITPPSTTTYRVRITNSCGSTDSEEATVTVEPCSYEVNPSTFSFGPDFSTGIVTVVTSHVCAWTASTTTPWITVTEGTNASGDDVVVFDVQANGGATRSGSVTVAGTVIPVTQGCRPTAITSQPRSTTVTIGGSATLSVTATGPAPLTYQWFAGPAENSVEISGETSASITVTPSTTTTYRVRVTSACGPIDSDGATVTVQPCSYTVSPPLFDLPSTSGNANVSVSTATTCSWSASTTTPWITITGGASGTGSGTTTFTFAANVGQERSGSITVAGRVIPVTQATPPCDPPVMTTQPQSTNITTGSPATLTVATSGTAPLTYQWYIGLKGDTSNPIVDATSASVTVTPSSTTRYWARITNACGSTDSGAAAVIVSPCTYDVSPASLSFPAGGGGATLTMTAPSTCGWSASTATPWITLTEGLSGSGNGQITFTVAPHTGTEPRSGSITVAGIVVAVSQSEPVVAGAPPTPTGVNARATLPARITFSWTAVAGATSYEIERRGAGGGFVVIGSTNTNSFDDNSVSTGAAYLYRVRALNGAVASAVSASDLALAFFFTDDPLVAGVTPIRAVHLSELRSTINAVRALAGLPAVSFTGSAVPGEVIAAIHLQELREALEQARLALGMPSSRYTDTMTAGLRVRAVHFNELRTRMR